LSRETQIVALSRFFSRHRATLRLLADRVEAATLIALLALVGGIWAFAAIAVEMSEGELTHFDETVLLALRAPGDPSDPIGPPALELAMRDLTALGGAAVLVLLSLAAAVALLIRRRYADVAVLAVAVAGGLLVSNLAKVGFSRPRPELVPHGVDVMTSSFPSGHSMMAAVTYLTLAVMLARAETRAAMKLYYLGLAAMLAGLVGVSRVYLGVHWPSDVLAGWAAGGAWALLVALVAQVILRRD
jgi:undecaprenyl-diphosphatase